MPVKQLQDPLQFTTWTNSQKSGPRRSGRLIHTTSAIGINTSTECIRIRTRKSHDDAFTNQLNLDDLLDVCISVLPDDAFALLFIVDQDMYQHDDDDFCCGMAAGGSRVAVVSTARYNPLLDQRQEIDRTHAWPASHCAAYVEELCRNADGPSKPTPKRKQPDTTATSTIINLTSNSMSAKLSPLHAAITAHNSLPPLTSTASVEALHILWLSRICRTASHELGHCLGIGHCVFYACNMQGSASIKEDARQPPYLCPVDLAKMLRATGADERERYQALLGFCEAWEEKEGGHMFAGFAGWLRGRMEGA
jgi:archaemetzincin